MRRFPQASPSVGPTLIRVARLSGTMDLFRKAGEKFEETKRSFLEGRKTRYVCRACEQSVAEDSEYCPHCGEAAVEPVEAGSSESEE